MILSFASHNAIHNDSFTLFFSFNTKVPIDTIGLSEKGNYAKVCESSPDIPQWVARECAQQICERWGKRESTCKRGESCKTSSHISPRLSTDGLACLQGPQHNYSPNFLSPVSFNPANIRNISSTDQFEFSPLISATLSEWMVPTEISSPHQNHGEMQKGLSIQISTFKADKQRSLNITSCAAWFCAKLQIFTTRCYISYFISRHLCSLYAALPLTGNMWPRMFGKSAIKHFRQSINGSFYDDNH